MKFCIEKNLRKLKYVLKKKKLFQDNLSNSVFRCILEILYNICNRGKREEKLIPKSVMKQLKREKKILRYLFNKQKSIEKRKQKFLESDLEFKKLIKEVLETFFEQCVVSYD